MIRCVGDWVVKCTEALSFTHRLGVAFRAQGAGDVALDSGHGHRLAIDGVGLVDRVVVEIVGGSERGCAGFGKYHDTQAQSDHQGSGQRRRQCASGQAGA